MSRQFDYAYNTSVYHALERDEWRPIKGTSNYYISNNGAVLYKDKILKPHQGDFYGHLNVRLKEGPNKEPYIHRLVAEAFIRNPKNLPIVRHLDGDPSNNSVENLAWGTQLDNIHDSIKQGMNYVLTKEDREKALRSIRKKVKAYNGKIEYHFSSISTAAQVLGVQQANIWKVLKGERTNTCGWRFEYE